jgi:hypothetical protein
MRRGGRVVMRREGRKIMSSGPVDSANVPDLNSKISALRARPKVKARGPWSHKARGP